MIIKLKYNRPKKVRGFTLAEAMIAMVILSMAAAGVLLPFSSGAAVQAEGMRSTLAAKLAGDLIEQIINTPFNQIVSNYNYSEPEGQVKDAAGEVLTDPSYKNFSREVTSQYVDVPVSVDKFSDGVGFILITVRVNYSGRSIAVVNRLISE